MRVWNSSKLTFGRKSKQPLSVRLFTGFNDCPKLKRGLEPLAEWARKDSLVDVGRKERAGAMFEVMFASLVALVIL